MKVFVYFNLHKKVWSVKALEGENKGRVVAHADIVQLANARPKVSEAGRQRVLREQRKNVHAGVVGEWLTGLPEDAWLSDPVFPTYNPYKYSTFVDRETGEEWKGSDYVSMIASVRGIMGMNVTKGELSC
jgi:hypothetical protein